MYIYIYTKKVTDYINDDYDDIFFMRCVKKFVVRL